MSAPSNAIDAAAVDGFLVPDWPLPSGVRVLITTRAGGASAAPYASFNLGTHVGDDPRAVAANRSRLRARLPAEPNWLEQVHGVDVLELGATARAGHAPPSRADAAFTRVRGVPCVVMTADCMPVVLAARDASMVGVVHAGWRGLAAGVIEACIDRMVDAAALAASDLVACLGPTISGPAYEVGAEVREAFVGRDAGAGEAFTPNDEGRFQFDLYGLARRRLAARGVREVHGGDYCTVRDGELFFSYRRDGRTGRMASVAWLE